MRPLALRLLDTAASTPDAVAIIDGTRSVTYGELAAHARRFADVLRSRGLGRGERVALVLSNGVDAAAAWYGCWLAGCIVVPLGPQSTAAELGACFRHCTPSLVLHGREQAAAVMAAMAVVPAAIAMASGDDADAASGGMPADAGAQAPPWPQAAILYTSGTTGAPKGVTLEHGNFAANVDAIVDYLQLRATDRTVLVLPFHYAYGASVLHTHLAVGASLVLEPNLVFPHVVVDTIERTRATGFSGVPSTFTLLLERGVFAGRRLDSLRYLTQAGGAMTAATADRLRAQVPGAQLFLMYGQTEATARLTYVPPERLDEKRGSVGRPLRGVAIEVRDERGAALPAGASGEVWARGPNVMAGYWNDPVATALVLRDGWLRTGDIGHLDEDGYLHLRGRRSDIIKTGAHRVHPLEVEEALLELPWVREAAVAGTDDALLGQVVKAWLVVDGVRAANAVRAHCRVRLAPHKAPRQVEFVDSLPRTASGKLRRAALVAASADALETP